MDPVEALEVFRQKRAEVEAGAELQVDDDLKVKKITIALQNVNDKTMIRIFKKISNK